MRRTRLALFAVTVGLLTLACSGGGASLLGPTSSPTATQAAPDSPGIGASVPSHSAPAQHGVVVALQIPGSQVGVVVDPNELDPDDLP